MDSSAERSSGPGQTREAIELQNPLLLRRKDPEWNKELGRNFDPPRSLGLELYVSDAACGMWRRLKLTWMALLEPLQACMTQLRMGMTQLEPLLREASDGRTCSLCTEECLFDLKAGTSKFSELSIPGLLGP
ncbi:hypothetical protein GOODEAATRI_011017 [Goodea atripinnis]|uniref:Uncharacterized protein n=1 Tax=Goodea atripinnis TaxID=208336 RepID=A0ABV0NJA2_9TELE